MFVTNTPQRTTMETESLHTFLCSAHSIYQTKWLQVTGLGSLWITTRFWNILDSLEPSRKKYSFGFHSSQLRPGLLWLCSPSPVYNLLLMCFYRRNRNQFVIRHDQDLLFSNILGFEANYRCRIPSCEGRNASYYDKEGFLPSIYENVSVRLEDRCRIPQPVSK